MKTQILEKLNDLKSRSGKSFEAVHDSLGFAASTVHRWHKGESSPDMDQLSSLVEFYGGTMEELFVAVGKQEMTATQSIGYQGADAMVEHYEAQLRAKDQQIAMLQLHHEQAIQQRDAMYDRSVSYLKSQVEIMQAERRENREELEAQRARAAAAEAKVVDMDRKRHNVFWIMGIICACLGVGLVVALLSDSIVR